MGTCPTLSEYWQDNRDLAVNGVKARTALVYERAMEKRVLPVLGDKSLDKIRKSDIRRFLMILEQSGLAFSTQTDHVAVLSRLFEIAVDDDLIGMNPAHKLRRRRPKNVHPTSRALSLQELALFLDKVPSGPYRRICAALALTGGRLGEINALTPADVHLERNVIIIARSVSPDGHGKPVEGLTKSGKVRAVPILPQFRPVLIEAMEGKSLDERIFTGPFGGTLTSSNLIRAIGLREWRDEVKRFPRGEPPLHIHDLRHTALTLMFEAGVPANWVQAIAGHSSLDVTMLYTGANEKAAVKAGELFGGYLEKSIQLSLEENHGG